MFPKYIISFLLSFIFIHAGFRAYPQQTVEDFYLSNYQQDGGKSWELKGKEAHVFDNHVEVEDMDATYYHDERVLEIEADRGTMEKPAMDAYLEENVRVRSDDGASLYTDSLTWKNKEGVLASEDDVRLENGEMSIEAEGFESETRLKKVDFQKKVKVSVPQGKRSGPLTVECEGPLKIDFNAGVAVFHDKVDVNSPDGKMLSDKATVFFDSEKKVIIKIIAEGNVKMIRDDNVTFAERAVYTEDGEQLVLEGSPRLILFPENNEDFRN